MLFAPKTHTADEVSSALSSWDKVWKEQDKSIYSKNTAGLSRARDRIATILKAGVQFSPGEKILEAGCGDGAVVIELAISHGVEAFGVDFSSEALAKARQSASLHRVPLAVKLGDVCAKPFASSTFDKVISLGVIEHIHDPQLAVHEMFRVLKPNGMMILMTPNSRSLGVVDRTIKERLGLWKFGPQDEYSTSELAAMARLAGFEIVHEITVPRKPMSYDSRLFRCLTRIDFALCRFLPGWGFFSYVIARKEVSK